MIDAVLTPEAKSTHSNRQWLSWNRDEFQESFGKTPFLIDHNLVDHKLFQIEELLDLSRRLDPSQIEYNAGQLPISIRHEETPMNGLSPEETIRRIAECKSWLVLKMIELDSQYGQLLEECLKQVAVDSEALAPGMMKPHAFVFITSPGSVTPYHIDPEHNFLLQIKGEKIVHMFDGNDPSILSDQELESFYCDRGRNLTFDESFREKSWQFRLKPGQGLHFPVTYPHYVENTDDVSISFSITFRTPDLDRRRALYRVNDRIRKLGMKPSTPGRNGVGDSLKYQAFRVWRKMDQILGRGNS